MWVFERSCFYAHRRCRRDTVEMNMHKKNINKLLLQQKTLSLLVLLVLFFVACSRPLTEETSTRIIPTRLNVAAPDLISPSITPTVRVFSSGNCDAVDVGGHIFFLQINSTRKRNRASYYDLYVMDGNGCFPRFVMAGVSGSPAWSTDGKRLAIGCENNAFLCLLDARATLDTCKGPKAGIGQCSPVILQRIKLPSAIGEEQRMYNISWSSDDSQIAVEGGSWTTPERNIYILTLTEEEGTWEIFMRGLGEFNIDWSPRDNQLALSGLVFINLKSDKVRAIRGLYPAWSHDGKKIAFVTMSTDEDKEPYGIASISLDTGYWEWLYEPVPRDDRYYFPPHNLIIRDEGEYHRLLSWSPQGQYIAFVAETGLGSKSHIYRLNVATGEIVILTANLKPFQGADEAFYAPAWGP